MKNIITKNVKIAGLMLVMLMGMAFGINTVYAGPSDFALTINNDVQVSDHVLEFDLYLRDTDATQEFMLSGIQFGILVNPGIYNGGTLTASIVSGASDLNANQQLSSITFTQSQNCIKIAPVAPVLAGTIISSTAPGTLVAKVRLTNTVAFTVNSRADLAFNFTNTPYATRVAQVVSGLAVALTLDNTNSYSLARNILLNPPAILPTATINGTHTICAGGTATLQVALTGTPPFTYLWSDDNGITTHQVISNTTSSSFAVSPVASKSYIITNVTDQTGQSNVGTGTAYVYTGPVTTIASINSDCVTGSVAVPVKVSGFNAVGAISLTLSYDPIKLDFLSAVNTAAFPGLTFNEPVSGTIKVAGYSAEPNGVSYPDNTTLFTLNFTHLGGLTTISFSDVNPSDCEYASVTQSYTPFCDSPSSLYYISGTVDQLPLATPVFDPIGPFCQNSTASLPATDKNGITGTWSQTTINTSVAGTFQYVFTPDAGQCANPVTVNIEIQPQVTPTFTQVGPLCVGSAPYTLPTTSNNLITGTWNPATVETTLAGTYNFTFTPDAGTCATTAQMQVIVNPVVNLVFQPVEVCSNSTPPAFPSTGGITGTWSPSVISTTVLGPTVYTFTPGAGQCASPSNFTVTVTAPVNPTFDPIGPFCQNSTASLPATDKNGITGTWSPSTINTSEIGNLPYTFTPDAGQCASPVIVNIEIQSQVTPTFTQVGPLCVGAAPYILPTTSNNQITGTWNPSTVETTVAGTYNFTFTPDAGSCATTAQMQVVVNPTVDLAFQPIEACVNSTPPAFPSTGGITGTWSPSVISTTILGPTVYTFTPDAGQCALPSNLTVTVNALPTATLSGETTICNSDPISIQVVLTGTAPWTYLWSDDGGLTTHQVTAQTSPSTFTVTPTANTTITITNVSDATGCSNVGTGSAIITFTGVTVTGTLTYHNTAGTPLDNVKIELFQNEVSKYSTFTDANGNYTFTNACPGVYNVVFTNNMPTGGINATDAAQVNAWGVGPQYDIEKVRFLAGDVTTPDIITSADAASILTHFVTNGTPAYFPEWKHWNQGTIVSENIAQQSSIVMTIPPTGPFTQNYYGMVTGDFNKSFIPSNFLKSALIGVSLINEGITEIDPEETFELPIYACSNMDISAISLILDVPTDKLEVVDVYLGTDSKSKLQHDVKGNELRIGWISIDPLMTYTNQVLLTLKLKNKNLMEAGEIIKIAMTADPLNELANSNYDVILGAVLKVSDVKESTLGIPEVDANDLSFTNYPNPVKNEVTFSYIIPESGKVKIELYSVLGNVKKVLFEEVQYPGEHFVVADLSDYPVGVYFSRISLSKVTGIIENTIKLLKQK